MSTAVASARGVSSGVVLAAVATSLGALPLVAGFSEPTVPTAALYGAGWPALGVAAALLLDRGGEPRVGRALAALAVLPAAMGATALVTAGGSAWPRLEELWRAGTVVAVLLTVVLLAWAMGYSPGRLPRRRLFWMLWWSTILVSAVVVADSRLSPRAVAVTLTVGLWAIAGLVTRLMSATELRPVDEPFVDAAAAALTLAIGAAMGMAVRLAGARAGIPAPDLTAAFAVVTSAALAWPAAAWWRRSRLVRRYGTGTLTPDDVASITADLHHLTDPRELLAKAAEMVSASTGHPTVALVLGEDEPDIASGWVDQPLLVAGDRVGTLLLECQAPEGPEPRQAQVVDQLLPTVALVCRAVGLAVEAEHARQDVARERDLERARILRDLHDGLGPVLAGLSMRVQAELRREPTPLLEALAPQLADARRDLRHIVSGLTPSALHDADLAGALRRLTATFDGDGRQVSLDLSLEHPIPRDVTVTVYRSVAEGITNAARHADPSRVEVRVCTTADRAVIDVRDDGIGGPITPGIGLNSLRQRAEHLGGTLSLTPGDGGGTLLHVELPTSGAA